MKNALSFYAVLFSLLLLGCSGTKNQENCNLLRLPLKTENEYLDIFFADGDNMITRPQHLGIVNGMASVGISHDYVGVLDGLWAIPLVNSDFYIEPRLWGERIKTDHYTWLPFQTKRIGGLNEIEVQSTTTLIYGMRAGILTLKLKNTNPKTQEVPLQFIANNPFTYCVTLDREDIWGFSAPKSRTPVTNVLDEKGIMRVQGDYAVAIGSDLDVLWWEESTRRFRGLVSLKSGEELTISFAFSIETRKKALLYRNELLADPDHFIRQATDHYISEVKNIYDNLPRFTSDNKILEQCYNRSLSIFITNKFNVPEFVINPYYGTGSMKGGCTCNYLWNFGQIFEILHLLDPVAAKEHIIRFIKSGCLYSGYAFYPLTGESFGTWYMVNQEKIIRHVYYYLKLTGDIGFLSEEIEEGNTVLDMMVENALHLDDTTKSIELVDYGVDYGASNSHLELRREYLYNHIMPDLNGRRYNNYIRVAEMCELIGQPLPILRERAAALKILLKQELWNQDIKWFIYKDSEGNKGVRYTAQMFKLFDSEVIDEEIEEGLLSHLNEEEFLSDYGLHSMSKLDIAYDQVDIDNGGGGNCTSFTPLKAEFLYNRGKTEIADKILNRILWWGTRMPYFFDSEPANEIDYRQDTPLQSNISTGCLAQCILFGMFGIDVDFDGTITINPLNTHLANELNVADLKIRGKVMDISVKGDEYEVVLGGQRFSEKLGEAITL
jgi:hypothetical protein